MATKDLDILTVLNQLGTHCDVVMQQLSGVLLEPGNVKGSTDHLTAIANQPKGGEKTIF